MEKRGFAQPRGPRNDSGVRAEIRMPTGARWYPLYETHEDFRLWFDNLARGSPTTAVERARVLYRFLGMMKWKLDELTEKIKEDRVKFEKLLMAFVGQQEKKGYAPGTIENYLKSIRSWANFNDVELVRKIKISNRNSTPTLNNEQVPMVENVKDIRSAASMRGRICVCSIAYGGLRPEILGHQMIDDGLKLGDLPELDLESLSFSKVPAQVVVRQGLSKAGHQFRTFLPNETCRDIIVYLERRKKSGEDLTETTPLVVVSSSQLRKGWRKGKSGHVTTTTVSRDIRKAMRPTYSFRPYVLRSFFSTRLLMAVSDGVLDDHYRVYWMGHKGAMSARYSSNKAQLPPDLIENMREAYTRATPYLLGSTLNEDELRKKTLLDVVRMWGGYSDDVLAEVQDVLSRTESVDEAIKEISSWGMVINRKGVPEGSGDRNLVVNGDKQLLDYVRNGWSFVRELEAESPKGSVVDEKWVLPSGEMLDGEKNIVAILKDDGSVEFRGSPTELDKIYSTLKESGVILDPQSPEPRYLLKKNLATAQR